MARQAAVIAVGNEVVHGFIANSNAAWLSQALAELGFDVQFLLAVTDRHDDIATSLREALSRGLLVVTTGGIGPTLDDLTREAAADALGVPLKLDMDDFARLRERYAAMGRRFPEGSERQCARPAGSRLVPNAFGTASCFLARHGDGGIAALPGVPREMKGVWSEELRAALIEEFGLASRWHSRELRVFGMPESELNNGIRDLLEQSEGAILVDDAVIRLRWRVQAETDAQADAALAPILNAARERLGEVVFAEGDVSLEQATVSALAERGLRAACAESVTGGMIAHLITNVAGSSAVLLEGAVTYHKDAKLRLGVKPDTLATHGTVSAQTTIEMAQAMATRSNADICVAVTGNAGPTLDQPQDNACIAVAGPPPAEMASVGTVFIAAVMQGEARAWRLQVPGDRELVKWRAARSALNTLRLAAIHGKLPQQIAQWVTPP